MTFFIFKGKRTTVIKKLFSGVEFREMGSFCGQPILALGLFSSVLHGVYNILRGVRNVFNLFSFTSKL